jgi:hypothetical protein
MTDELAKVVPEILDSKTVQKVYDDGLQESVSEAGSVITDTVKSLRLLTAPIQLAAAYQDRLSGWIYRTVRNIPEERRIEAPARIAGPIIDELRYLDEGDEIAEMYLRLLGKAIDKKHVDIAHPAFVKIIGHLSPDEALILHYLKKQPYEEHYESTLDIESNRFHSKTIVLQEFPVDQLVYPSNFYVYTSHLISLDLIQFPVYRQEATWETPEQKAQKGEAGYARLQLTKFGGMFVNACEPYLSHE